MGNLAFAMLRYACGIKPEPYVIVSLFCVILCMGRGSLKFGGYKASLKFGGYEVIKLPFAICIFLTLKL